MQTQPDKDQIIIAQAATIAQLIANNQSMSSTLAQLTESNQSLLATVERLTGQIEEFRRMLFGQRRERLVSEKLPPLSLALRKRKQFTEAEILERHRKTQEKRQSRALEKQNFPVIEVHHDITECPHCKCPNLIDLGIPEVSEEYEYVPSQLVRRHHIRSQKRCSSCCRMVTAPAPNRVVEGGHFGAGFHAHVAVSKCADALPFHRQAKRFQRAGFPIQRSTLERVFHRTAELLSPLSRRILELVSLEENVNADETPLPIQAPNKCKKGYMWTFLSGKLIGYEFSASRSGETPLRVLGSSPGRLQVDLYKGYNQICVPEGRERIGCLAHVRRKFFNALKYSPVDAEHALSQILELYEVEYEAALRGVLHQAEHLSLRRAFSQARLESFIDWIKEKEGTYAPKSPMAQALDYAKKVLPTLRPVMEDARLRLDNNIAENTLRIVALGRKNYMFVGDEESGRHLAVLMTLVSTCVSHDVNPERYIADVLLRLDSTPKSRIDDLLPMNWKPLQKAELVSNTS